MIERGRAALRRSVIAAVKDAKTGGKRAKNPFYRKDAKRDRAIKFTSLCAEIANFDGIEDIAAWCGTAFDEARIISEAEAAIIKLQLFLNLKGKYDVKDET